MRTLVFDTGPLISLTLNNLLWIVESLHEKFDGDFYITPEVYKELIERPLATKKYKFEALQILPLITRGIIKVSQPDEYKDKTDKLLELANSCLTAKGNHIRIVHMGEVEAMACALHLGADTIVIDERTSRVLIESPALLKQQLERKLHTSVSVEEDNLKELSKELSGLKVIRSFELVTVAYELGLLNMFAQEEERSVLPDIKKAVLEGVLWAVKLSGCSVKTDDIYSVLDSEDTG